MVLSVFGGPLMARLGLPLVVLVSLLGCRPDTDADGLSDRDEKLYGTNAEDSDSDGDGLSDLREVEVLHSDPLAVDSDGDRNLDADEDEAGTDLNDPDDYVYAGAWPFYPRKDDLPNPGWDGGNSNGDVLPRFADGDGGFGWVDQFGDTVDIYDFAFAGRPIILDLGEFECYYCHEVGKLLQGKDSFFSDADDDGYLVGNEDYFGTSDLDADDRPSASQAGPPSPQYDTLLPQMIADGDVYWITVIDGDYSNRNISAEDAAEDWVEEFNHEAIPVLIDEDADLYDWFGASDVPWTYLIGEDMTVLEDSGDQLAVWNRAIELTGAN